MSWIEKIKKAAKFLYRNRTATFAYGQVVIGVLATSGDIFGDTALKVIILTNAMLTALLAEYNRRKLKREAEDAADPQP